MYVTENDSQPKLLAEVLVSSLDQLRPNEYKHGDVLNLARRDKDDHLIFIKKKFINYK